VRLLGGELSLFIGVAVPSIYAAVLLKQNSLYDLHKDQTARVTSFDNSRLS